jgi:EmrB/QacA subfamily drug resistance transporter
MTATTTAAPSMQTHRPLVFTALVLAMFMAAIEATIVATAMPSIVEKLGGMALYSWVFSAFLLMQAISTPIFGKLSDIFGRKRVFMAGILLFLLGSVLCGLAWSMTALVAFRFVQGLGAGAVQPLAITLIGDLYTIEERSRVQGYVAGVWGVSSILGPLAGALIVRYLDWAWVFWMNLPFGALAVALAGFYLHEEVGSRKAGIDYAGAGLLLVSLSALMLALTEGGHWGADMILPVLLVAFAALALFAWQERRAPDPIVHLELWQRPLIARANLATLASGVAMIGVIAFLPIAIQGVLGESALVAGFALCAMSVGWPIASVVTGRLLLRVGVRRLARIGGTTVFVGGAIVALAAASSALVAGAGSFIMGAGMGVMNTTFIVSIQASVDWSQRGVATSSYILMRILGNAFGAALLGGVLNLALRHAPGAAGMATGVHWVFGVLLLFTAAAFAAAWSMPDQKARGN